MQQLQINAYGNMVGAALTTNLNMNNKEFRLSFPDNLYEKVRTKEELESSASYGPTNLISLSSGNNIVMRYNPTGSDHCFYIYIGNDYTDESKQLYKYDYSNRTLRRNKTTYVSSNIGTIITIPNVTTMEGLSIVGSYMKYATDLDQSIQLENNTYKSSVLDTSINDYFYEINTTLDKDFVLVGPNRVYKVSVGEKASTTYSLGNYYYFEEDNTYGYCFDKIIKSGIGTDTAYDKINRLAITGYAFIMIGTPEDDLYITVNGTRAKIRLANGSYLTLEEWMANDCALRVEWSEEELVEYDRDIFNPNAEEYLIGRSPYGTNYIYNFKYLYDCGWMSKEDILDIYRVNKIINGINIDFYNRYTQDLINLRAKYDDAVLNEEIYSTKADAQLEALMSNYIDVRFIELMPMLHLKVSLALSQACLSLAMVEELQIT